MCIFSRIFLHPLFLITPTLYKNKSYAYFINKEFYSKKPTIFKSAVNDFIALCALF